MVKYKELIKEHIGKIVWIYVDAFNLEPWNDEWTIESASKRIFQIINCEGFYKNMDLRALKVWLWWGKKFQNNSV